MIDPGIPDTKHRRTRLRIAISIGAGVALLQLLAFSLIAYRAYASLISEASPLKMPFVQFSFLCRDQIIFPVNGGAKFSGNKVMLTQVDSLRNIDLRTGEAHDEKLPVTVYPAGFVCSEQKNWTFGQGNTVVESDGTSTTTWKTTRAVVGGINLPFLYEDRPALIEHDSAGRHQLLVLTDREWEVRGEIALPGADRSWVDDGATGKKVLLPRTSANDSDQKSKETSPQIVWDQGRTFVLIPDSGTGASFREGCDFV